MRRINEGFPSISFIPLKLLLWIPFFASMNTNFMSVFDPVSLTTTSTIYLPQMITIILFFKARVFVLT